MVEGVVPCVNAHADADVAEVERDYGEQNPPGPTISPPMSNKAWRGATRRALSDVLKCPSYFLAALTAFASVVPVGISFSEQPSLLFF
jgi:hypothetical protein